MPAVNVRRPEMCTMNLRRPPTSTAHLSIHLTHTMASLESTHMFLCGSIPVSAEARAEWVRWMERCAVEVGGRRKFIVHIPGRLKFTAGIQSS